MADSRGGSFPPKPTREMQLDAQGRGVVCGSVSGVPADIFHVIARTRLGRSVCLSLWPGSLSWSPSRVPSTRVSVPAPARRPSVLGPPGHAHQCVPKGSLSPWLHVEWRRLQTRGHRAKARPRGVPGESWEGWAGVGTTGDFHPFVRVSPEAISGAEGPASSPTPISGGDTWSPPQVVFWRLSQKESWEQAVVGVSAVPGAWTGGGGTVAAQWTRSSRSATDQHGGQVTVTLLACPRQLLRAPLPCCGAQTGWEVQDASWGHAGRRAWPTWAQSTHEGLG